MSLSKRDSVKVKAALAELHHLGHNTAEVTDIAASLIRSGTPARKAYDTAFNKFVARVPSAHAPIQRIGQLIEATDTRTIASYNVALDNYIRTGDREALRPVVATVSRDLRTMAQRTGDAGFAEGLPDLPQGAKPEGTPSQESTPDRPGWGAVGYRPSEAAQSDTGQPAQTSNA